MSVPRQLSLELGQPPSATFDNFLGSGNVEAVEYLRGLLLRLPLPAPETAQMLAAGERLVYLYGEAGSGRSHLLQAACERAPRLGLRARYLGPHSPLEDFYWSLDTAVYAVDDIDQLNAAQQVALFNLFNDIRPQAHGALLSAGPLPPMALPLREDLRTRLGWGLVYRLQSLTDADKVAALQAAARARGLHLSDEVPQWLLTHFYRDMPSLMALLDALDTYSLEQKRAVTLPLVRKMLAEMSGT